MFILSNFITAVAKLLDMVLEIFFWLIVIRALLSWVNPDPYNTIVQFLYRVTEPILQPIRRFLPMTGIDLSPVIAFFGILFLRQFLIPTLYELGLKLH